MSAHSNRPQMIRALTLNKGFTLLEVLVSLAILAVISITILTQISNSSAQLSQMENRTFGRMLVQNKLAEIRLGLDANAFSGSSTEFANRNWYLEIEQEPIDLEEAKGKIEKVTLGAYLHNQRENPSYRFVGYNMVEHAR